MPNNLFRLIISLTVCLLVGFAGSLVTFPSVESWYSTLQKPFFSPPNWLFAPVWTLLYILMGIAAYLVWRENLKKKSVKKALFVFVFQLVLNFLWSFIFFGLRSPLFALGEIIILWMAIVVTIKAFQSVNKYASWLLVPYLLWVSFAAVLNGAIFILNR